MNSISGELTDVVVSSEHTRTQYANNRLRGSEHRAQSQSLRCCPLPTCARTASSLESPGCATQSQPWCYLEPIPELLPYASPATQWSVSTSALRQLLSSINHHTNALLYTYSQLILRSSYRRANQLAAYIRAGSADAHTMVYIQMLSLGECRWFLLQVQCENYGQPVKQARGFTGAPQYS